MKRNPVRGKRPWAHILLSVRRALKRPVVRWAIVGVCTVTVLILGMIGYTQRFHLNNDSRTAWDALYLSINLLGIDSGSTLPPVPATLQAARILGMAVAFSAVFLAAWTMLRKSIAIWRLGHRRGHVVVCGLGERGARIAEAFLSAGRRVGGIEIDARNVNLAGLEEKGCTVVTGDATDPYVLATAGTGGAAQVIAVCENDGVNAEVALRVARLRRKRPKRSLDVVAHIADTELCQLLRDSEPDLGSRRVHLRLLNVPESGAKVMLDTVPPVARDASRPPHIVVVDLDRFGRCLVEFAVQGWRGKNRDALPRITAIDPKAEAMVELLHARNPWIREESVCRIEPLQLEKNAPEFELGSFLKAEDGSICVDAIYVCTDDDVKAAVIALTLHRHTKSADVPIAVRMAREAGLATLLKDAQSEDLSQIEPIDVLGATCSLDALLPERGRGRKR